MIGKEIGHDCLTIHSNDQKIGDVRWTRVSIVVYKPQNKILIQRIP